MTFNTLEVSTQDGRPVSLYEFRLGNTYWRMTNAEEELVFDGVTYFPAPCSDSGIRQDGTADASDPLKVQLASDHPVPLLFRGMPPSDTMWLRVRRPHYGDTEAPVLWVGFVQGSNQIDEVTAELGCLTLGTTMKRGGLRYLWGRQCNHFVFGPGCDLDKADFAVAATLTGVTPTSLSADEIAVKGGAWFDGGFVERPRGDGSYERRGLTFGGSGDTVAVFISTAGFEVGDEVILYPGCGGDVPTCKNKFNNLASMDAVPHMSGRSPFDGNPVF